MGLLSTEVEVKLGAANIDYFEQLGYEIPRYYNKDKRKYVVKRGTIIWVKVKDLRHGCSSVKVDLECDNCFKKLSWAYNKYIKYNHDGKCYCRKCAMRILNSGENNGRYNPNKTDKERELGRNYPEYTEFVKSVLTRDNYTCYCCNKRDGSYMSVHHLFGYSGFPEYRTDQSQAITLCNNCHKAFHYWHREKYGYENRGNCTRTQFEEWLKTDIEELNYYDGKIITARRVYDYEDKKIYNNAIECADSLNAAFVSIYNCCNHKTINKKHTTTDGEIVYYQSRTITVKGHHLFWLDEYEKMSDEELNEYINAKHRRYGKTMNKNRKTNKNKATTKYQCKCVICVTTGKKFDSLAEGAKKYNIKNPSNISECCRGKKLSAGKLSDGTPLHWMFYEDFLKLPIKEQNEILSRNQESSSDGSFIM